MFQFDSFHMYGIIASAIAVGVLGLQLIKRFKVKNFHGERIYIKAKNPSISRYLIGGITFGLGWALAGACPGPMFTLVGAGFVPILIVIIAAIGGTYLYGLVRDRLPH